MSKCNTCEFRKSIPGDAHVECGYPLMDQKERIMISMVSLTNPEMFNQVVSKNFGFTVASGFLSQGYFQFPMNFDAGLIQGECSKHSDITAKPVKAEFAKQELLRFLSALNVKHPNNPELLNFILSIGEKGNALLKMDEPKEIIGDKLISLYENSLEEAKSLTF